MEPRPVAPGPDYPAVVRIVPATHGVAFLEGSAALEEFAAGRIVICRSDCAYGAADVMVRFLLRASAKMLDRLEAASPIALRGPAPAADDAAGRSRCGARPSALTVARGAR